MLQVTLPCLSSPFKSISLPKEQGHAQHSASTYGSDSNSTRSDDVNELTLRKYLCQACPESLSKEPFDASFPAHAVSFTEFTVRNSFFDRVYLGLRG
jgi:hypothetical protein